VLHCCCLSDRSQISQEELEQIVESLHETSKFREAGLIVDKIKYLVTKIDIDADNIENGSVHARKVLFLCELSLSLITGNFWGDFGDHQQMRCSCYLHERCAHYS